MTTSTEEERKAAAEKATKLIVKAIERFLNGRKGYHLDCLPDDIRRDFLKEMRTVVLTEISKSAFLNPPAEENSPR